MNVLVTGGLGFIGSNYIRSTIKREKIQKIINIDKVGTGANPENLAEIQKNQKYCFIRGDITNKDLIQQIIKKIDTVVNFAAETHVDRSILDPEPFIDSNILGSFTLLEAERKAGKSIRHIQISTDEIYGDIIEGSFKENDILKPSNPYSAAKAAADLLCLAYHRTYEMDIIITRCTNNFGPYQYPEKLIPKTIIRAIKNLDIPIYGTGESIRDWLYVSDHCNAIQHVLEKGNSGEIYNISSGNHQSVKKIVSKILEQLDRPDELMSYVEDRPGHDFRYSLDSSKLRKKLGWQPAYDFNSSIRDTVNWYLKNEAWWKPLINKSALIETPWSKNTKNKQSE